MKRIVHDQSTVHDKIKSLFDDMPITESLLLYISAMLTCRIYDSQHRARVQIQDEISICSLRSFVPLPVVPVKGDVTHTLEGQVVGTWCYWKGSRK